MEKGKIELIRLPLLEKKLTGVNSEMVQTIIIYMGSLNESQIPHIVVDGIFTYNTDNQ